MLALKLVLPPLPVIAGLSANHLAALDLPPAPGSGPGRLAPPRCRPRQRRRRSPGGAPVAGTRHRRRHRNPRSRAGLWRLQPRSLPSRPRQHAGASRGSAVPPDRTRFLPDARRSDPGGEPQRHFGSPRRKKERLFVCLRRRALGRTEEEPRGGLPERRFAGGEAGFARRRPTIFRRRADHSTDTNTGETAISPALQREAK